MRWIISLAALIGIGFPVEAAEKKVDPLVAALIETLDDPDTEVRQNIAIAIANLGDSVVPALIDALADAKAERRMGAAIALGQVRPPARNAVPALVNAMKDKDESVRRHVSYALSRVVGRESSVSDRPVSPTVPVPPPDPVPSAGGPR
ncbi:MAG: HEAT repeat domain-containing protein [Planctomycetes bacterium]|nr:HEAT repeat domain-containing protein [Planctomycetota bacterium]